MTAGPVEAGTPSILVYGIGNPGRQDDGLGPVLAERGKLWKLPVAVRFVSNFQLNIEDSLLVSEFGLVVFVDASRVGPPFGFDRLKPEASSSFSTHEVSPRSVLALCAELYGRRPEAYLLAIRGFGWEPASDPTPEALANLDGAASFLEEFLSSTPMMDA